VVVDDTTTAILIAITSYPLGQEQVKLPGTLRQTLEQLWLALAHLSIST